MDFYWKKMLCINKEDARIFGSFDSEAARQLNIQLKRCEGEGCASDEEIEKEFRNKYIIVLVNESRFVTDGFGTERLKTESRLIWLSINSYFP